MESDIKIEKGMPIPTRGRLPKLPLEKMDPGDSFVAPVNKDDAKMMSVLRQRVSRENTRSNGKRYSVTTAGSEVRVFRVA